MNDLQHTDADYTIGDRVIAILPAGGPDSGDHGQALDTRTRDGRVEVEVGWDSGVRTWVRASQIERE